MSPSDSRPEEATGRSPAVRIADGRVTRVTPLQNDPGSPAGGIGVAFSVSGDLVARAVSTTANGSIGGATEIRVWNLHTGAPVGPGWSFENQLVTLYPGLGLRPDGARLVAGIMDGRIIIWDVGSGRLVTKLKTQSDTDSTSVVARRAETV